MEWAGLAGHGAADATALGVPSRDGHQAKQKRNRDQPPANDKGYFSSHLKPLLGELPSATELVVHQHCDGY